MIIFYVWILFLVSFLFSFLFLFLFLFLFMFWFYSFLFIYFCLVLFCFSSFWFGLVWFGLFSLVASEVSNLKKIGWRVVPLAVRTGTGIPYRYTGTVLPYRYKIGIYKPVRSSKHKEADLSSFRSFCTRIQARALLFLASLTVTFLACFILRCSSGGFEPYVFHFWSIVSEYSPHSNQGRRGK